MANKNNNPGVGPRTQKDALLDKLAEWLALMRIRRREAESRILAEEYDHVYEKGGDLNGKDQGK